MKNNPARDFSIGFVLFVATIVVMGALFAVGDGKGILSVQARFQVEMPNANGLRTGARVYLSGVPVGKVADIDFARDPAVASVIVVLSVDSRHARRLGPDSTAWVKTEGLLGDTALHLSLGSTERPLPPGSEIPYNAHSMLDEIAGAGSTQNATDLMQTAIAIMQDIHKGEGTLGQLLKSPDLYENLTAFTQAMRSATEEVEKVAREVEQIVVTVRTRQGLLGKLIFSEEYADRITGSLQNAEKLIAHLERIAARAERGEGSLGRFLTEPDLHDGLVRTLADVDVVAKRTGSLLAADGARESVVARLLTDEDLGSDFRSLVGRLDRSAAAMEDILLKIRRGDGSVGMLVNDPSIAGGIRDVILGVQDLGYVRNVVRNAERSGREGYLKAARLGEVQERELLRVEGLARLGLREPAPDATPDDSEGEPRPATGQPDDAQPVPTTDSPDRSRRAPEVSSPQPPSASGAEAR